MPNQVPFPGISMLIHLVIVLYKMVFSHLKKKTPLGKNKISLTAAYVISGGIILSIFCLVMGTAAFAISESLKSPYSNIHFAQRLYDSTRKNTFAMIPEIINIQSSCEMNPNRDVSLVNYMKENGMAFALEDRIALAEQYGMQNYSGSSGENLRLLSKLKERSGIVRCISMAKNLKI